MWVQEIVWLTAVSIGLCYLCWTRSHIMCWDITLQANAEFQRLWQLQEINHVAIQLQASGVSIRSSELFGFNSQKRDICN